MFLHACVKNSVHRGGKACVAKRGLAWWGVYMVEGAWKEGHAWQGKGVGCGLQGGMHGRGLVCRGGALWQGASMSGVGHCGRGVEGMCGGGHVW